MPTQVYAYAFKTWVQALLDVKGSKSEMATRLRFNFSGIQRNRFLMNTDCRLEGFGLDITIVRSEDKKKNRSELFVHDR